MKGILERTILIIRHIDGPLAKNLIKDIEKELANHATEPAASIFSCDLMDNCESEIVSE